jgi:hypothetical protein
MYELLRDYLTESAKMRIALQPERYQVNGINNGPCNLKMILIMFYIKTNATSNFLPLKKLHNLPEKMTKLKFNISKFNTYVQETVFNLSLGGQSNLRQSLGLPL